MTLEAELPVRSLRSALVQEAVSDDMVDKSHDAGAQRLDADAKAREQALCLAHEDGYQQGMKAAEAAIATATADARAAVLKGNASREKALAEQQQHLETLASSLSALLAQVETALPDTVAELTYSSLSAVLRDLHDQEPLVRRLVRETLRSRRQRPAVLYLAPDDLAMLSDIGSADLELISDAALAPGACRLEDARGNFEASIGARLDAIRNALVELVTTSGQGES